jgi:hypothetical protein
MSGTSRILVIDDEAAEIKNRVKTMERRLRGGVTVCNPDEVTLEKLDVADLVLVDYKLDHWDASKGSAPLCRKIPNGIALMVLLQQHATECDRPTAFAIHSSHLRELTAPFPPEPRVHLLARTYNLEWAFVKSAVGTTPTRTFEKAHILAKAVAALPQKWPVGEADKAREIARGLLGVPSSQRWEEQAWQDVEQALPPLDELTLRIHGILFLRWLLTRVLYYPCFLLNRHWLAARLGATPDSVDAALSGTLGKFFRPALYTGILKEFAGRRWWRSGIESLLWDLTEGNSAGSEVIHQLFLKRFDCKLTRSEFAFPVVCLDEDYRPLPDLYDPKLTVRLQLDDWPSHAEIPRTTIEIVHDSPRMKGLVLASDRELLETDDTSA